MRHFPINLKKTLFSTIFFLCCFLAYGYDQLYIRDPQGGQGGTGSIEEATISIKPKGLYMEYGVYLTFSAKNIYFYNTSSQLEIQYNFDLPQDAMITDSWLWVGDSIIQAKIMDQWTASRIYESIVNRRRDPSILFKRGQGNYEMKIYPMKPTETRKIKITYLLPVKWLTNIVSTPLPTNLLRPAAYKPETMHLLTWPGNEWQNPRVLENPEFYYEKLNNGDLGSYHQINVPSSYFNNTLNFAFNSPMRNGIYVNRFEQNGQGYYQMALLPSQTLNLNSRKKVAILVDYDANRTNISNQMLRDQLKSQVKVNFSYTDSINIIYNHKLDPFRTNSTWFPADSAGIENAFKSMEVKLLNNYSDLNSLLRDGIDFVKNNGNNGSIILITASHHFSNQTQATDLVNGTIDRMNPIFPIHIADFLTSYNDYSYINGSYYYGNGYMNANLSKITLGHYMNMRSGGVSFSDMLGNIFQAATGSITSFDLHTTLKNGYCFDRYYLTPITQTTSLNKPILQVGQYEGSFPFVVQVSGKYKSKPFSKTIELDLYQTSVTDASAAQIISGNNIINLEKGPQSNEVIREIIHQSIQNRVLSYYTAFLALEPSDTIFACQSCMDETKLTAVQDKLSDSLSIAAAPNPFNSETSISIRLRSDIDVKNCSFVIYNMTGQIVKHYTDIEFNDNKSEIIWDGTSDSGASLPNGLYNFVMNTSDGSRSLKLVLAK